MDLLKLTEEIILSLVQDKDIVAVKEFQAENENEVLLEVVISESDMPRVIGKSGKVINSIRTIVQASSYLKDNKKVKINIDSI
ncbi:MAG: KH domain-containing protein [Bacilli bacterium]